MRLLNRILCCAFGLHNLIYSNVQSAVGDMKSIASEQSCRETMRRILGVNDFDLFVYGVLLEGKEDTKSIAQRTKRERSSVQRSLARLVKAGLCDRSAQGKKSRGYYYQYRAVSPANAKKHLKRCIDRWYADLMFSLNHFEEEVLGKEGIKWTSLKGLDKGNLR